MRDNLPIYAKSPMSVRNPDMLAHEYGYYDVEEMAGALPEGARIADIGAGESALGRYICSWRDDVDWTNIDVRYNNLSILNELSQGAPDNLHHVAGDVLGLLEACESGQFDHVYSYWMIQHLCLEDFELGVQGTRNMLEVAKPTGRVAIGPIISRSARRDHGHAFRADLSQHQPEDLDVLAEDMTSAAALSGFWKAYTYMTDRLSMFDSSPEIKPEYLHTPTSDSTLAA